MPQHQLSKSLFVIDFYYYHQIPERHQDDTQTKLSCFFNWNIINLEFAPFRR